MSEELKPCPLCGCEADDVDGVSCMSPSCSLSDISNSIPTKEQWNSAYCWEEIDRLKAQLAEKENLEPLKTIKDLQARFEAARAVAIDHYVCCQTYHIEEKEVVAAIDEEIESLLKERSE